MTEFPIMTDWRARRAGARVSIPWGLIAPHEAQAQRNHAQSLKRLAERGGLSAAEAVAVLEDRGWRHMPDDIARARLEEITVEPA